MRVLATRLKIHTAHTAEDHCTADGGAGAPAAPAARRAATSDRPRPALTDVPSGRSSPAARVQGSRLKRSRAQFNIMIGRRAARSPPAPDAACTALRPTDDRDGHTARLARCPTRHPSRVRRMQGPRGSHRHTGTHTQTTSRQALIGPRLCDGGSWGRE